MAQDTFCFGFRYEKTLGERIRTYCREEGFSLNHLVDQVLAFMADLHDRGRMDLFETSRFKTRPDREDKMNTSLALSEGRHEMLRNLAFTYRISMAEVIRLGLEMYLDVTDADGKLDDAIHTYRTTKNLIHTVITSLYPALPKDKIAYPLLL